MDRIKGVVVVLLKDLSTYGESSFFYPLSSARILCSSTCNPLDLGLRGHKDLIKGVVLVLLKSLAVTDAEQVKDAI